MELTDILKCPATGNKLRLSGKDSLVRVEQSDVTYPIVDRIIDFCPHAGDAASKAYDAAASRYDACLAHPNMIAKAHNRVVWGFWDDWRYAERVLSYLPSQFDGVLLDVPVGTGIFTSSLYAGFPNATIIAIDYSMAMLQKARSVFLQRGLNNIHFLRADAAHLPVRDAAIDILVSMNGLHAFADKPGAISEMRRVIRENGKLTACCYVRGMRRLSDWFVTCFGVRRGYFSLPLYDMGDITSQLQGFTIRRRGNVKSVTYFEAVNKRK